MSWCPPRADASPSAAGEREAEADVTAASMMLDDRHLERRVAHHDRVVTSAFEAPTTKCATRADDERRDRPRACRP